MADRTRESRRARERAVAGCDGRRDGNPGERPAGRCDVHRRRQPRARSPASGRARSGGRTLRAAGGDRRHGRRHSSVPREARSPISRAVSGPHWLRALEVRDFRNLTHVVVTLPPDGIVIVGDNGHGKTNLLEAIAYLHLLRSVRGARDVDVVRFGATGFSVRGVSTTNAGSDADADLEVSSGPNELRTVPDAHMITVGFERASRRKRATVDGVVPERLSDALGSIPSVTFSPVDVDLVRGAPIGRRRYLDVVLATTSKRYLAALQSYRGALVRRNAALRSLARRHAVTQD